MQIPNRPLETTFAHPKLGPKTKCQIVLGLFGDKICKYLEETVRSSQIAKDD